jgi:hypothetical protein
VNNFLKFDRITCEDPWCQFTGEKIYKIGPRRKIQNRRQLFVRKCFKITKTNNKLKQEKTMENVRHVVIPIVAKRILENIFNLYVSFLSHSPIKIVSQKMVILSSLSQKLVSGFFQQPVL